MWTYVVVYECDGERKVYCGEKYASELIARYLLAAAIRRLEDKKIFKSAILYIPTEKKEQSVSDWLYHNFH
jgi:hypothetical protein